MRRHLGKELLGLEGVRKAELEVHEVRHQRHGPLPLLFDAHIRHVEAVGGGVGGGTAEDEERVFECDDHVR